MTTAADEANLAIFIHRYAIRHVRTYPHPIERVWRAVTDPKELSAWYVPGWTVEPRLGGAWSCSYGAPSLEGMEGYDQGFGHGVITTWDPPRVVDYGGQHRFELEEVEGGTRLTWSQAFDPSLRFPKLEATLEGDNPGGPGYPMFAGGQAGNHLAMDQLRLHLDGRPLPADDRAEWRALTAAYDAHFRRELPKFAPSGAPLATFDHRRAMRYVRVYPHPIERVFEAVTTAEHLDVWMLPHCRIERRLGGEWAMTFGGPDLDAAVTGTIVAWDPPQLVDYGGMRFELESLAKDRTRLTFIHAFAKGIVMEATDQVGGDLPGGPDTPWRPGFVAGFHIMLDELADWLDGTLTPPALIDGAHPGHLGLHEPGYVELVEVYRDHIRRTIPAA